MPHLTPYAACHPPVCLPACPPACLQNVLHLIPKPPPKPYTDYLENWAKVMRFSARLVPSGRNRELIGPHDAERRCVCVCTRGGGGYGG